MVIFLYKLIYVCIFGRAGSPLLCWLSPSCSRPATHRGSFSCCAAQARGVWASVVAACRLWTTGSVVVVHALSCSTAGGIFLDQGSNLYLSCIGRWILHHWAARHVLSGTSNENFTLSVFLSAMAIHLQVCRMIYVHLHHVKNTLDCYFSNN